MIAPVGRPRPPQRLELATIFVTHCDRCYQEIDSRGIGMECGPCVTAARKVWPNAMPITGGMSGV